MMPSMRPPTAPLTSCALKPGTRTVGSCPSVAQVATRCSDGAMLTYPLGVACSVEPAEMRGSLPSIEARVLGGADLALSDRPVRAAARLSA